MSEERRQQEPTMEEILASIRRIISEDNRSAPGAAAPAAASADRPDMAMPAMGERAAEASEFAVQASGSTDDAPDPSTDSAIPLTDRSAPAADPIDADEPAPLDLTNPLPPAPDQPPISPLLARRDETDADGVLDLTNEVRDDTRDSEAAPAAERFAADRPDRPTFLSRETVGREQSDPVFAAPEPAVTPAPAASVEPRQAFTSPAAQAVEAATVPEPAESHPMSAEGPGDRLLSATTEAATMSALARLRQAAARQHEPAGPTPEQVAELLRERVDTLLDERFDPALRETLQPALAEHLPAAIREQVAPLVRERVEPVLREEVVTALDRRLDPMLREQVGPALRERLEPALHDRLETLLHERLDPLLREQLDPLLHERLDPLLRERLDLLLRHWIDRNLPGIVERIVEREIERLVGQPGSN